MIDQTELKTIEADRLQGKAPVRYQQANPAERAAVDALIQEIDLNDSHSLLYFGVPAQQQLAGISDDMLEGVRNKDTGPAGEALNRMVGTVRGFELGDLDPNRKPGFFARLFGKTKPVAKFLQRYEEVRDQIDAIEESLRIADDGRRKRAEAAAQLETLESELRRALVSASARVKEGAGTAVK
ncbi:MAG: toxic anion resistance protein [Pseudomonadota bacterium]|nr:toxic anion resistance protein [Pseudomonadota bacterium]